MNPVSLGSLLNFATSVSMSVFCFIVIVYLRNRIAELSNRYLYVCFGVVGVPVHEFSHLIVAILTGHKIEEVQFFKPGSDNSLGYVSHSYRPSMISPFTNLLIGIAPLFGGTLAFVMLTKGLMPELVTYLKSNVELSNVLNGDLSSFIPNVESLCDVVLFSSTNSFQTALWLFLSYSVIVYSVPSKADLSQSKMGVLFLCVVICLLSIFTPSSLDWIAIRIASLNSVWLCVAILHSSIFFVCWSTKQLFFSIKPTPKSS